MNTITTIVVEDEIPVAKTLEKLLNLNENVKVIGLAHNVKDAEKLISESNPNLVFCDIQLSNTETGFDLLEKFPNPSFKLVFITAYNEYAIKAFKYNAIDYLLKPVDSAELTAAITRVSEQINSLSNTDMESLLKMIKTPSSKPKKILFKSADQVRAVDIETIVRLESESNYTCVHLNDSRKFIVSKSLKEYSDILEERKFFRAHQSHLINLEFFEIYEKQDGGYIKMKDGTSIPVAKRKKNELFEMLENL